MFILWFIRFFVFTMYESPKYLMGRGRDEDAVKVVAFQSLSPAILGGRVLCLVSEYSEWILCLGDGGISVPWSLL